MKGFFRSKRFLTIVAFLMIAAAIAIPLSGNIRHTFAASRSSHNIAYVNYDDSGFTGASIPSGNIFTDSIVGGPAPTSSAIDSVSYNGMTFTPLARAALSATTLAPYDTLILFEVCDIATSLTTSQHGAINAYLAAGNKILLYDGDRCAAGTGGVADYSWFTYPFATSSPGPQGASGVLTVVENSTLTQGLSSDPFNSDELGDANTATTTDPHWFAAARTTNALGNNGYFLAYARNTGLIIYDGADHWFTSSPTQSLTDLFLNELNQMYDPDNLPGSVPLANIHYFAFGDSYSSGEGNPPFFPATDTRPDFCHRSPQAYSQVLGAALKLSPMFYACSGAVTDDITKLTYYGEQPQLNNLPTDVNATFGLATMTIGGNNAGFGPVLKSCIEQRLWASIFNAGIGPIAVWLGLGKDPSCVHSPSFVNAENAQIDHVFTPVKATYLALLNHVSQTDTSVIVADYPHLFPDTSKEQSCLQLAPFLTTADQQYFNLAGDRLDNVLAKAAAQAGVNFVDVRPIFAGHGVCGSGGAWINGVSIASSTGCTLSVAGNCIIPDSPTVGSFHPNASGHASGYAVAIENYIKSATNLTVEGFPANPPAAPAAISNQPVVTANATDAVQRLMAQPLTSGTTACEGTYTAGQQVLVSGSGFAPNASVRVYVTSAGLKPAGQQQVAQFKAGSTGSVSGIIRIPLATTGFTLPGSKAGVIFIDAIGTGPGGVHVDDVDMEGLAKPGSACSTTQFPFKGFEEPVDNFPRVNTADAGESIMVKFDLPGIHAPLNDVLASGYPQSAPVSCSNPAILTSGEPTVSDENSHFNGDYTYIWKTKPSWLGCRELIVKLADGSYHWAVFNFSS
ncbi:MAG TPA: PxKF domain-containing protein [Ktedonobacteraceae bacterium]|nr:PxKF domain-containing protein [Ktedonobacteraceae bacterium]